MAQLEPVLLAVEREYKVTRSELLSPTRGRAASAWARHVAMYLCHVSYPAMSWTAIGREFNRDRTTVRKACENVEFWRGEGDDLDETLSRMEGELDGSTAAAV